ncbi:hypothetical protein [Romboutsia lituseburensis]|uniref:hypothetical protein n=1 Tax=Romboutsia lituseburensis TaxID=1537 RepID=UPI00215A39FE|nr:hypothetical protein [Romboutsia lituseburensis]MCR8746991.1 hypothetical protein [Romboutsia lituseburensis]
MFNNWSLGKHILTSLLLSIFIGTILYLTIKFKHISTLTEMIEDNGQSSTVTITETSGVIFISLVTFIISMIGYRFVKRMLD